MCLFTSLMRVLCKCVGCLGWCLGGDLRSAACVCGFRLLYPRPFLIPWCSDSYKGDFPGINGDAAGSYPESGRPVDVKLIFLSRQYVYKHGLKWRENVEKLIHRCPVGCFPYICSKRSIKTDVYIHVYAFSFVVFIDGRFRPETNIGNYGAIFLDKI